MVHNRSADRPECQKCGKKFGSKSSLGRHIRKKCNQSATGSVRRKSCNQCALAKVRCDLDRSSCRRCVSRGLECVYPNSRVDANISQDLDNSIIFRQTTTTTAAGAANTDFNALPEIDVSGSDLFSGLDNWNSSSDLMPLSLDTNAYASTLQTEISSDPLHFDFLGSLVQFPVTEIPITALTRNSMELIFRVLRTWPRMIADEFQFPPLFHHTQFGKQALPVPLAKCFTLAKMWHKQAVGAEEIVNTTIMREVDYLLGSYKTYNDTDQLATLQAMVIYTIMLLFPTRSGSTLTTNHELFWNIQQAAWHVAEKTGLVLEEEQNIEQGAFPTWEAWIDITSKRRAVLAMYLLHWAYAVWHRIPSFDCKELGFIPAPAAKVLWQSQSAEEWSSLYIKWLARWDGKGYMQREFDKVRLGIGLDERTERWLEEADEFGFIMISIVNATERHVDAVRSL